MIFDGKVNVRIFEEKILEKSMRNNSGGGAGARNAASLQKRLAPAGRRRGISHTYDSTFVLICQTKLWVSWNAKNAEGAKGAKEAAPGNSGGESAS